MIEMERNMSATPSIMRLYMEGLNSRTQGDNKELMSNDEGGPDEADILPFK